jgi:hypothetical protein
VRQRPPPAAVSSLTLLALVVPLLTSSWVLLAAVPLRLLSIDTKAPVATALPSLAPAASRRFSSDSAAQREQG